MTKKKKRGVDPSGHSFKIGGASLKWSLGTLQNDLIKTGRWRSGTYKVDIRKYSAQLLRQTRDLLRQSKAL